MHLETIRSIIVICHALAATIGVGGVIVTDYIFIKFLKGDHRISKRESSILKHFSEIIWIALGLLIVTGIFLVSTKHALLYSPKFQLKMVIVFCTIINGLVLNFFITPKLHSIGFYKEETKPTDLPDKIRKIALVTGVISISSWFFMFILGSIKSIPFTLVEGVSLYLLIICGIALGATFTKKKME
jgi:uncharacterized membrane protein